MVFASIACNKLTVPLLANLTKLRATKGYQVMLKATGPAVCPYNAWAEIKDITHERSGKIVEILAIEGAAFSPFAPSPSSPGSSPTRTTGYCRIVVPLSDSEYYEIEVGAEDGTIPEWVLEKAEMVTVGGKVVKQ